MTVKDDFSHFDFQADDPSAGRWTIERELDGSYALYAPTGMRTASIHWDSAGRCWAGCSSPEDNGSVGLHAPVFASDAEALARVLSGAQKPADVQPLEPEF